MVVTAGVHDRWVNDEKIWQYRGIIHAIVHPNYKKCGNGNEDYDIALLKMANPFELNEYVKPACIPKKPVEDDLQCIISGWGRLHVWCMFFLL